MSFVLAFVSTHFVPSYASIETQGTRVGVCYFILFPCLINPMNGNENGICFVYSLSRFLCVLYAHNSHFSLSLACACRLSMWLCLHWPSSSLLCNSLKCMGQIYSYWSKNKRCTFPLSLSRIPFTIEPFSLSLVSHKSRQTATSEIASEAGAKKNNV